jgi:hypothetical protein
LAKVTYSQYLEFFLGGAVFVPQFLIPAIMLCLVLVICSILYYFVKTIDPVKKIILDLFYCYSAWKRRHRRSTTEFRIGNKGLYG